MYLFDFLDIVLKNIEKAIPFPEIKPRIINMDPYFDDEQILSTLLKNAPTMEEIGKLKPYLDASDTELSTLSMPDRFALQVCHCISLYILHVTNSHCH